MNETMVALQVAVPTARESEFYSSFYSWFAGWRTEQALSPEPSPAPSDHSDIAANATKWWRSLTPNERKFWGMLADASPNSVPERDIIEQLGLTRGPASLRGSLSHVYPKAERAGFATNWDRAPMGDGQTGYRLFIKQEQLDALGIDLDLQGYVELVKEARARAEREEAAEIEKFGPTR